MKYFAKIEKDNRTFGGWYSPEVQETMFDTITHMKKQKVSETIYERDEELGLDIPKVIEKEIEVLDYIEYKPKFNGVEYTEKEYNTFMKEGNKPNAELRFNSLGQLEVYTKPPKPEGMVNGEFNYDTESWEEKATLKEQTYAQYQEYSALNNPLRIKEMKSQGLYDEWEGLMYEMEDILFGGTMEMRSLPTLPEVSLKLETYKNKFKLLGRGVL